jgi:ABC-type polysaccharide/polyol phosphate export permease
MRRYRFLYEQLVRRELRQKYQGSILGLAWYVVNPVVLMAAYWFMFGRVLTGVVAHADYPLFLMAGLLVWLFFSQSLLGAAGSLIEQGSLIRKARFPREVIPAAVVSVQFVTFAVVLAAVTVLTVAVRGTLGWPLLLLPVVLAALYAFAVGLALVVSVLHAYFRDVAPILAAVLLPWFFVSPIFFDPSDITQNDGYREALQWANPIAPFITAVRDVVYGGTAPSGGVLLYIAGAALVALAAGVVLFRRMEGELAVVV